MMIPSNMEELGIENNANYNKRSWFCVPFHRCVKTVNIPYSQYNAKNTDGSNLFSTPEEMQLIMAKMQSTEDAKIDSGITAAAPVVDQYELDFNWEGEEGGDEEHDKEDFDWSQSEL